MDTELIKQCRRLTDNVLKERCLKRDSYTCVKCGAQKDLEIHHKKYRIPPKLSDLQTLCVICHRKLNKNPKQPSCSKCDSSLTYIKFSTNERICRKCGNIEKLEDEKK